MLTQGHLTSIKPQAKMRRYYDGHGLYLQVMPQGGHYWRMKYHIKVADPQSAQSALQALHTAAKVHELFGFEQRITALERSSEGS